MIHVNLKKAAGLLLNPTSTWFYLLVATILAGTMVYTYVPAAFLIGLAKLISAMIIFFSSVIDLVCVCGMTTGVEERKGVITWFRCRILSLPLQGFMMSVITPIAIETDLLVKVLVLWACMLMSRYLYMYKLLKKSR